MLLSHASCTFSHLLSRVSWPQHMSTVAFSPSVLTQVFFSGAQHAGIHGQAKCLQAS